MIGRVALPECPSDDGTMPRRQHFSPTQTARCILNLSFAIAGPINNRKLTCRRFLLPVWPCDPPTRAQFAPSHRRGRSPNTGTVGTLSSRQSFRDKISIENDYIAKAVSVKLLQACDRINPCTACRSFDFRPRSVFRRLRPPNLAYLLPVLSSVAEIVRTF